ncbi:Xylose ABC transporter, periplasmic xylose-binding protein XylF [Fulvivirga imtechensis AK7]|uniref:histidine kinase n=1 Tax=Fulvivirga imtechensis AK7 TaxID=1237149 RepID=L8K078_9BACT|nr:substrate-binding domain-containing protein [Fulvivirga imtechensis]ELR73334.1 Xylose ABC transporter, periplasmic xylose-binding protein XylF [Fulvivirga imtechensis AK7]
MKPLFLKLLIAISLNILSVSAYAQKVGLLLGSYVSSRWYMDQKLFTDRATELGMTCSVQIAYTPEEQLEQAEKLIREGIDVLVVVPLDAIKAAKIVDLAKNSKIPVISYDRLIFSNDIAIYISYDNEKVGRLQAEYMVSKVPEGNYFLLNGPISDNNAILFRKGQLQVLEPHIQNGNIKVVDDVILKNWSQLDAFEIMTHYYASEKPNPDVILAANDAIASGVIQALPSEYTGKVQLSGQDADLNSIRSIISGTQSMTVYKPIKPLADMAAEMTLKLYHGETLKGRMKFDLDTISVEAILLEPMIVDRSNYKETVLRDGHASLSEVVNNLGEAFEQERNKIRLSLLEKENALEVQRKESQQNIFVIILTFFLLSVAGLTFTIYHKQKDNKLLNKQKKLIEDQNDELNHSNEKLRNYNEELTQQQEEISAQRDAIALQNRKLEDVKQIIEQQRDEILHQNERLEQQVQKRTAELVQYVQQLEEYAFLTAHNLRAPVARIMGLGQLIQNKQAKPEEIQFIIDELTSASQELRLIFDDLNTILDIRTFSMEPLTEVDIEAEIHHIVGNLQSEISHHQVIINIDLKVKTIFSIRPYIQSILFNLITNAIKFRHHDRRPEVSITTQISDDQVNLCVSDNGLGIDQASLPSVFQLYKRFHFHVKGRGIGLYLVKSQVDSLGGSIKIDSKINEGTRVCISLAA